MTQVLRVDEIDKSFGHSKNVLRGLNMTLDAGEVVALLGPNGSGKTTLFSIIVGATQADQGTVDMKGATCGYVPQKGGVYSRLTVRENIELFSRLFKVPGDTRANARKIAEEAGLMPWFNHLASELSGGLRQRLNISIGLLGTPQILILDEPTTGLDLLHRHDMWVVLKQHAANGKTVLYSTHSIEDAQYADRICVLVDGKICWTGRLNDLPGAGSGTDAEISSALREMWQVKA